MGTMAEIIHRRWSDNDRYFGPFTYAREKRKNGYRPIAISLESGCDEYPGASFRISGFGHTFILALPEWALKPYREKVYPKSWDEETVKRLGRNWYWDIEPREYGFSISEGFLNISYGRRSDDSRTEQRWGYFLPWTEWRHVRHSFYDINGEHFASILKEDKNAYNGMKPWERHEKIKESVPTMSFEFDDFDGERITATTRIEEREWRFGEGWFKWMSLFRKPKISRSLDLHFSAETGDRKGSWKGGTIGHAIKMLPGELHEQAFRRYCEQNNMTFVGLAGAK